MPLRLARSALALLLGSSLVLAGCGGDSTGPSAEPGHTLRFDHTGGGTADGTYTVSGRPSRTPQGDIAQWSDFTMGVRSTNEVAVLAFREISGSRGDVVMLFFQGITEPRQNIPYCESGQQTGCAVALVLFDADMESQTGAIERVCVLFDGTAHLDAATATGARGRFGGSGTCFTEDSEVGTEFTLSGGTFDVAVEQAAAFPG